MKDSIKEILTIQMSVLIPYGEAMCYKSWSEEFKQKNFLDWTKKHQHRKVTFSDLTNEECELLGFSKWSDDLPIRLIPIWLYNHLELGQTLIDIDGKEVLVEEGYTDDDSPTYIDCDHRMGMLAIGFRPAT